MHKSPWGGKLFKSKCRPLGVRSDSPEDPHISKPEPRINISKQRPRHGRKQTANIELFIQAKLFCKMKKNEEKGEKETPNKQNTIHGSMWNPEPQAPTQVPDTHTHPYAINHPGCPSKIRHNVNAR